MGGAPHAPPQRRGVAYIGMVEAVLIIGGLMLFVGFFMDWVSYRYVDHVVSIKGSEFGRVVGNYPETLLLPFIGIMFVAGGLFSAGRRRAYAPQKISRGLFLAGAWISAIIAMFLSVYLTIRYSDYMMLSKSIAIYNNLDIGWFITISGNMVLYIGCILAVSSKARKLGISDYYFVRSDSAEKASDVVKAPPPPHPMPPPSQGMPPHMGPGPHPPPRPPVPGQAPPPGQPRPPGAPGAPAPPPGAAAAPKKEEEWK